MNFEFTDRQAAVRKDMRRLAAEGIEPKADELDHAREYPAEILSALGEQRIPGITLGEEYGGLGYGHIELAIAVEEIAAALMSVASALAVHLAPAMTIEAFGTTDQREQYLPDMAQFETVGALGVTEADAGNDKQAMETRAEPDASEWVLNGSKRWVTNLPNADIVLTLAKTTSNEGRHDDVTAFLVPADEFEIHRRWNTLGLRCIETCEATLDDVRVPDHAVVGEEGRALEQSSAIHVGGIGYAARGVGIARAAMDDAATYAAHRHQFDQPIAGFQGVRWKVADMETRTDAARLLTLRAADCIDRGIDDAGRQLRKAKVYASEAAEQNASEAVQIHGGVGYTDEHSVERYYRDAKLLTIGGGANEVHRNKMADGIFDDL